MNKKKNKQHKQQQPDKHKQQHHHHHQKQHASTTDDNDISICEHLQQQQHQQQQQYSLQQQQPQILNNNGFEFYRNKLAQSLSRNIPPTPFLKESQKDHAVQKIDRLTKQHQSVSIADKIDIVKSIWQTVLEEKSVKVDNMIESKTDFLLNQCNSLKSSTAFQQQFNWEQTSKGYKNKGNELFQKKQYLDALLLYSEALRLYNIEPVKDPQILSSIYSNRCLCLVNLEKFEEGAIEATRGIECKAADNLIHKLLYRRGICYFSLKKHNRAKQDFQEAHKLVSKMDGSDIQSIESYLEKINKMKLSESDDEIGPASELPALIDHRVEFKYQSDSTGRIAEANEPILSNTILFQEKSYVSCLDRFSHSSHCHNCFKEVLAPIYCKKCNDAQYCSDQCLQQDSHIYHEKECGKGFLRVCSIESLLIVRLLVKKNREVKSGIKLNKPDSHFIPNSCGTVDSNGQRNHLVPTTTIPSMSSSSSSLSSSIPSLLFSHNNNDDQSSSPTSTSKQSNNEVIIKKSNIYRPNYDTIYSFNPHFNEHSASKLVPIIFESFIIERFLSIYHKELGINSEDVNINLIVRHLCQLSAYIYSIPVYLSHDDVCQHGLQRYFPVKIAYAIFPMASLLNHSCDNNTLLQYSGTSILIKSLKDIAKDEEITACYGPHAFHSELKERLLSLKQEYFFVCHCQACSEKSSPNPLQCPNTEEKCPGTLLETINVLKLEEEERLNSYNNDSDNEDKDKSTFEDYENRTFTCNKCGLELTNIETFLLTSQALMSNTFFDMATKMILENSISKETETMLFKCLEVRQQIFKENSKKIGEIYDALARFYIAEDNYKDAVYYAEKAVNNIFNRLGHSHSTELAREWAKLANIYINAGEPSKAIKAINTAESLLVKWKTEPGDEEILSQLRNHKKVLEASKVIPGTNKVEINLTQLWSQPDFDSNAFLNKMMNYHRGKSNF
eukprot:gene2679-3324_t